jgi:hypothetical protein
MIDLKTIIYHQTNTWPDYVELSKEPNNVIADFIKVIYDGVFTEINRLMTSKEYPNCNGIGHVVLISICSAIDSISAYAYGGGKVGKRFTGFISKYFPNNYLGKEDAIYQSFRNDGVHGWNLHKSWISPLINDPNHLSEINGIISLSLYDFFNDLQKAFQKYYEDIKIGTVPFSSDN